MGSSSIGRLALRCTLHFAALGTLECCMPWSVLVVLSMQGLAKVTTVLLYGFFMLRSLSPDPTDTGSIVNTMFSTCRLFCSDIVEEGG